MQRIAGSRSMGCLLPVAITLPVCGLSTRSSGRAVHCLLRTPVAKGYMAVVQGSSKANTVNTGSRVSAPFQASFGSPAFTDGRRAWLRRARSEVCRRRCAGLAAVAPASAHAHRTRHADVSLPNAGPQRGFLSFSVAFMVVYGQKNAKMSVYGLGCAL